MGADAGLADLLSQARQSNPEDFSGRAEAPGDHERYVTFIDIIKTPCVSGHDRLKVLVDLAAQRRRLLNQVAAVSCQELKADRDWVSGLFDQAEAVDRGAINRVEIGVIGLVARIGGLAELFGGQRVNRPGVEPGLDESPFDREVIPPGPLDGDDHVQQTGPLDDLAYRLHHRLEAVSCVLDRGGRYEDLAVEVGQHPFGAGLGTINADDAEMLRTDGLNPGVDDPAGLVDQVTREPNDAFSNGKYSPWDRSPGKEAGKKSNSQPGSMYGEKS